jgi:nucleotide-binding universal stress UspA family protein
MIFERILCGVDGSPEGEEALRQAIVLRAPEGKILAVVVSNPAEAAHAGFQATRAASQIEEDAERAVEAARAALSGEGTAEVRHARGRPVQVLLELAERERATVLAVGSHGGRRAVGIALGGVATTMLHEAPCSVLVARPADEARRFPSSIVLGLDGSGESEAAATVAFDLRDRFGTALRVVVARGGKGVDPDSVQRIAGEVEPDPRPPVDALVDASREADLLVVGSRGLHGLRALGSVSERIAHQAACSVLVVRPAMDEA